MAEVNTWACDVCGALKKPQDKTWWRGSTTEGRIQLASFDTMRRDDEKIVAHLCGPTDAASWAQAKLAEYIP